MNPERWQKVKTLFETVVELAPAEQARILKNECGDDEVLRRAVEELIDSDDGANSFLEQPAAHELADFLGEKNSFKNGRCFGHYGIIGQLGAGGMGEVYLAYDQKLDRHVAIKILNHAFGQDASSLKRFVKEAKSASALNHPNILVVHEIGADNDEHYIVSEFIEGKTLREVIRESPLTLSKILEIIVQIANALAAAHTANIVHRDVKPENVMIRPDGYVKVLDFGLAKLIEQENNDFWNNATKQNTTAQGVILGTINYMSPEQAKGEMIDARTDVFSLGIVIYEMLAGRTPFAGNSMSETFANLIGIC